MMQAIPASVMHALRPEAGARPPGKEIEMTVHAHPGSSTATGQDLTFTFTVDQTPEQAYAAIVDPRAWWSENIEGPTDQVGGEFVFHNEPVHVARFRVTELVPGRRVGWHVLENQLSFV